MEVIRDVVLVMVEIVILVLVVIFSVLVCLKNEIKKCLINFNMRFMFYIVYIKKLCLIVI